MAQGRLLPTPIEILFFLWACPMVIFASIVKRKPSRLARTLGPASSPLGNEAQVGEGTASHLEQRVAQAVKRASRWVPGDHNCLSQAIAGQLMLTLLGRSGRIVIGMKPTNGEGPWDTHGWLVCGGETILGGEISGQFSPATVYAGRNGKRVE